MVLDLDAEQPHRRQIDPVKREVSRVVRDWQLSVTIT